jgi:hypothetical protein
MRDIAAYFDDKTANSRALAELLRGGAIYARWQAMGGMKSALGSPRSAESLGDGASRYVTFDKGAIYWSPPPSMPASPAFSRCAGLLSEPTVCSGHDDRPTVKSRCHRLRLWDHDRVGGSLPPCRRWEVGSTRPMTSRQWESFVGEWVN